MAKQRVQVNVPMAGTVLSPKASPVSTYHTPLVPLPAQDNSLLQLAEGLRAFTPGASQLIDRLHNDKVEADSDTGTASVGRYENQAAFKKAVDAGEIPRAASPWFQKARRLQQQRLAAEEYTSSLNTAYASSNLQNFDDPQALRDFASSFTSTYVKERKLDEDEREFTQVFAPAAANAQANLLSRHATQRMAAIEQEVTENTEREVGLMIQNDLDANGEVGAGTAERISATVNEMYLNGLSGTVTNDVVAKAVIREAEERGDSSILDLLDQVPSGSGMVGQVGRVRDLRKAAEARIWQATHERQATDVKMAKVHAEQETKKIQSTAIQKLIESPNADIKPELSALAALDPNEVNSLRSFRAAWIGDQDKRTEMAYEAAFISNKVNAGDATFKEIQDAYSAGDINQDTFKKLAADLPKAQQMRGPLGNPLIKETHFSLAKIITGDAPHDPKSAVGVLALQAQGQFLATMTEFMEKPHTQMELLKAVAEARDNIQKAYVPDALKAAGERKLNPDMAMIYGPEEVDWKTTAIYETPDDLIKDIKEYKATGAGRLATVLGRFGVGVKEFVAAQDAALVRRKAQEAADKPIKPKK